MTHVYQTGETVKLIRSTNIYVPKGSLLKIESINVFGEILNVTHHGQKYVVHVEHVVFDPRAIKEVVQFT